MAHTTGEPGSGVAADAGAGALADAGAGAVVDAGAAVDAGSEAPVGSEWLHTTGNRILHADGSRWRGRGANLQDTRGCNACTFEPANVGEVLRRLDTLVDDWGANFIRLTVESYATSGGRVIWASPASDPATLADLKTLVAHARTKPNLYVMISLWVDPTMTTMDWPTTQTSATWQVLARAFKDDPRVIFGLTNEPESNFNGQYDAQVWSAMNQAVQAIRDVEAEEGTPHHLVAVQGTRAWGRSLDYYLTHPITAGGGQNVIYETHVYDPAANFRAQFEVPAQTLPVIIGEFGPVAGAMTDADCTALMTRARAADVPHLAWTFHQRCPPNLIEEAAPGCGVNMPLRPTAWGTLFKAGLNVPW